MTGRFRAFPIALVLLATSSALADPTLQSSEAYQTRLEERLTAAFGQSPPIGAVERIEPGQLRRPDAREGIAKALTSKDLADGSQGQGFRMQIGNGVVVERLHFASANAAAEYVQILDHGQVLGDQRGRDVVVVKGNHGLQPAPMAKVLQAVYEVPAFEEDQAVDPASLPPESLTLYDERGGVAMDSPEGVMRDTVFGMARDLAPVKAARRAAANEAYAAGLARRVERASPLRIGFRDSPGSIHFVLMNQEGASDEDLLYLEGAVSETKPWLWAGGDDPGHVLSLVAYLAALRKELAKLQDDPEKYPQAKATNDWHSNGLVDTGVFDAWAKKRAQQGGGKVTITGDNIGALQSLPQ